MRKLQLIQFQAIARLADRQAEEDVRREFGMKLAETRIICMVGAVDIYPFKVLTTKARFDKGHASRTVACLVAKGFMVSEVDTENQRATLLRLTTAGRRLYREIVAIAVQRNEQWMKSLPEGERDGLTRALSTLYGALGRLDTAEMDEISTPAVAKRQRTVRRTRH